MMTPSRSNFKVIVVGGGPVGLIAAHMLHKAGIDFLILERRPDVTVDEGASLALWPPTFRILDQLDLKETLKPTGNALRVQHMHTLKGDLFAESTIFSVLEEHHGHELHMFHRADLMKAFYNNLPPEAKSRVLLGKKVVNIEVAPDGVLVSCDDGTVHSGSMVLGVDGVNSNVRSLMRKLALKSPTPPPSINEEKPYLCTYRLMFGNAPRSPMVKPGITYEAHGHGNATQLFVGREKMWFFMFEELPEQTREQTRYSREEEEAYAAKFAHVHMSPDLTFKEVWESRNGAGLTNLGEGVVKTWGWNRIVLAGDAAHKVTPNIGWGFNAGCHDVVVLTNALKRMLDSRAENDSSDNTSAPTTAEVQRLFDDYQAQREPFVKQICGMSAQVTRMGAWHGWIMKVLDRWVWPKLDMNRIMSRRVVGPLVSTVPVLEFLEEKDTIQGKIPWLHPAITTKANMVSVA